MNKVIVLPHLGKDSALNICKQLAHLLKAKGAIVLLDDATIEAAGLHGFEPVPWDVLITEGEAAIVIGGDGALLSSARNLAPHHIPLMGINTGHLGFLTQVEIKDIEKAIGRLLSDDYTIDKRMMLQSSIFRSGELISEQFALNDVVITKGALARIISLATYIDNQHVATYRADGLIVSTPTGSTGYSLSAGGPIVNPSVNAIIVTPICAHTLNSRALIASGNEIIEVCIDSHHDELMLTADGQVGYPLVPGDRIRINSAPFTAELINATGRGFYELVRARIDEGRL